MHVCSKLVMNFIKGKYPLSLFDVCLLFIYGMCCARDFEVSREKLFFVVSDPQLGVVSTIGFI